MKYNEFVSLVDETYNKFNWRYGQSLMNVLHGACAEKYNELISTNKDCYYDDNIVPETLKYLKTSWIDN